jgi:hypothetical protein
VTGWWSQSRGLLGSCDSHADASIQQLLGGYAATLAELRQRGVIRTNNAPLGDYAEWLLAEALGGVLAESTSAKSHDMTLPDGRRVQVKARLVDEKPKAGQLQTSPFRSWDFELAALMLFRADSYQPSSVFLVPVDVARAHSKYRKHINGAIVFIRPPLTNDPTAEDITEVVTAASQRV